MATQIIFSINFLKNFFIKCNQNDDADSQHPNDDIHAYYLTLPYFGNESRYFSRYLLKIIRSRLNVKVIPIFKSYKIGKTEDIFN